MGGWFAFAVYIGCYFPNEFYKTGHNDDTLFLLMLFFDFTVVFLVVFFYFCWKFCFTLLFLILGGCVLFLHRARQQIHNNLMRCNYYTLLMRGRGEAVCNVHHH